MAAVLSRIRVGLAAVAFLFLCLQGGLLSIISSSSIDFDDGKPHKGIDNILDKTVELLFMGNKRAAREYLKENSMHSFKYYTHELPRSTPSYEIISHCHEDGRTADEGSQIMAIL